MQPWSPAAVGRDSKSNRSPYYFENIIKYVYNITTITFYRQTDDIYICIMYTHESPFFVRFRNSVRAAPDVLSCVQIYI